VLLICEVVRVGRSGAGLKVRSARRRFWDSVILESDSSSTALSDSWETGGGSERFGISSRVNHSIARVSVRTISRFRWVTRPSFWAWAISGADRFRVTSVMLGYSGMRMFLA
jgi:hypothetical protein